MSYLPVEYTDLTGGIVGRAAMLSINNAASVGPPPAAPTITTQPGATTNLTGHAGAEPDTTYTPFEIGRPAIISAVVATADSDATLSYQWQKLSGSSWADVAGQTAAQFSKASCVAGDDASYRVVVTAQRNGQSASTTSAVVDFRSRFLFLQSDTNTTGPLALTMVDNDTYTQSVPVNTSVRSLGAFVRLPATPTTNSGGMSAPRIDSAVSSNENVALATADATGRQTKVTYPATGTAAVVIKVSNLQSTVNITVS